MVVIIPFAAMTIFFEGPISFLFVIFSFLFNSNCTVHIANLTCHYIALAKVIYRTLGHASNCCVPVDIMHINSKYGVNIT